MGFDEWADFSRYPTTDGNLLFVLNRDLMYRALDGVAYLVRANGEPSDLGSIPKFLWPVLPPHEFPSAYFLHDELCNNLQIPRLKGDRILKEALIASHAPKWKAFIIYLGVRLYAIVNRLK